MNKNREMLKEAIADAKTIKDSAITNAKAILEETFGTKLKSMLAAKLEEMDDEENQNDSISENEEEEDFQLEEMLSELEKEDITEEEDPLNMGTEEEVEGEEDEDFDLENASDEEVKEFIESVIADMVTAGELEPGANFGTEEEEGEMDSLDLDVDSEEEETEEIEENKTKEPSDSAAAGADALISSIKAAIKKTPELAKKLQSILSDLGAGASYAIQRESKDLQEALKTVRILKREMNEVNLLNSKLLYNQKILKENNVSQEQKLQIIKSFDKATSVKEAKIIYDILKENFDKNKNTRNKLNSRSKIQERLSQGASKTIIKENTKPRILESDQMVERFQKLAGIKKS